MLVPVNEVPASLAQVLAPLPVDDFLELLRRRELTYRPGANSDRFAPVASWAALRRMIEADPGLRQNIRVSREAETILPSEWTTDDRVDLAKLDALVAGGYSVIMSHFEAHLPPLTTICQEIRTRTREGAIGGAIVTHGAGVGALSIHYDPEDIIVLQVEGTKRWQIFGPPVPSPLRGMPKQVPPASAPIFDEVLTPGDLLFLPAGYWHHCESGLSTSVHLTILFQPPALIHVVRELVRPLMDEELFRKPLTRPDGEATLEAAEVELKRRLTEKIGALKLEDFVAGWHRVAY
jgi:hypothetical protein